VLRYCYAVLRHRYDRQILGRASVATTDRYLHTQPTDSSARHLGV